MKTHCSRGHAKTPDNIKFLRSRGCWECVACRAAEKRRHRKKKINAGRWWEDHTVRQLSESELHRMAHALAHGMTIMEFASRPAGTHAQIYYRWTAWKHAHPKAAARFKRLSNATVSERKYTAFQAKILVAMPGLIKTAPPDNMWEIIDSAVPRHLFSELRAEVCQQLAIEVLERRCECSVDALTRAIARHKAHYLRAYANPWGSLSLESPLQSTDGDQTIGHRLSKGLWD